MIDFACKTIDIRDVLRCSFELTQADLVVLEQLNKTSTKKTSAEIEQKSGLERSTVQRSLKRLTEKKLCERRQENNSEGGYLFYYTPVPQEQIAERVLVTLDGFRDRLRQTLTQGDWTATIRRKTLQA